MLKSLNDMRPDKFEQTRLETIFEKWWPDFQQQLKSIPMPSQSPPAERSERNLLQEVLAILRAVQTTGQIAPSIGSFRQDPVLTSVQSSPKESLRVQLLLRISELELLALEEKEVTKKAQIGPIIYALKSELNSRLI